MYLTLLFINTTNIDRHINTTNIDQPINNIIIDQYDQLSTLQSNFQYLSTYQYTIHTINTILDFSL